MTRTQRDLLDLRPVRALCRTGFSLELGLFLVFQLLRSVFDSVLKFKALLWHICILSGLRSVRNQLREAESSLSLSLSLYQGRRRCCCC